MAGVDADRNGADSRGRLLEGRLAPPGDAGEAGALRALTRLSRVHVARSLLLDLEFNYDLKLLPK